ncbi:MAG: hypothetical protein ACO3JL_21165, partial [Myxococcota bacterium]
TQSFSVQQPTQTSDVVFVGADLRPFALPNAPLAILSAGYMHSARFIGDIEYTLDGKDYAERLVTYFQWSVEPRALLNVPGRPFAPGLGATMVYQPLELFAASIDVGVYYGKGLDLAAFSQDELIAEFLFDFTLPFAFEPVQLLAFVTPSKGSPVESSEKTPDAVPESENLPSSGSN